MREKIPQNYLFINFFFYVMLIFLLCYASFRSQLETGQPVDELQAWYIARNPWSFVKCTGSVGKSVDKRRELRTCSWTEYQQVHLDLVSFFSMVFTESHEPSLAALKQPHGGFQYPYIKHNLMSEATLLN